MKNNKEDLKKFEDFIYSKICTKEEFDIFSLNYKE